MSPANPGSSAAAGDSVAFQATTMASSGLKNGSNPQSLRLTSSAGGRSAIVGPVGGNAAQMGVLEKPSCIGTQVGVSTYSDDPLHIWMDTDESDQGAS